MIEFVVRWWDVAALQVGLLLAIALTVWFWRCEQSARQQRRRLLASMFNDNWPPKPAPPPAPPPRRGPGYAEPELPAVRRGMRL